jgi:hypothetical protein
MSAGTSRYVFCWFFSNIGQSREGLGLDQLRDEEAPGALEHALGQLDIEASPI